MRSRNLTVLLATVLCFAALSAQWSAPAAAQDQEPAYGWTDDPSQNADLSAWTPDFHESPYFETWDFWFWADDGTFVMVQYLVSSFGFGIERNASGRLIIVEPNGRNVDGAGDGMWSGDRGWQWDDDVWNWTEVPLEITFDDCYIHAGESEFQVYLRGRDRRAYFEATMTLEEDMFRPGDGRVEFGWDRHHFYDQQVLPRYSFDGRINLKESRSAPDNWQPLSGVGYGEHTLTNDFPFEVGSVFQGFRALRDDGLSIVFDGFNLPVDHGNRNISWVRAALAGESIFEGYEVTFAPTDVRTYASPSTEYAVPYGYEIFAEDGDDWVRVVVNNAELVSAESPFARVGALLRSVLGAIMAPYDFELAVDYFAWIHVDGETAYVSGRGWSTMNFSR